MMSNNTCQRCGRCCHNNGLIPPLIPGEKAPNWLSTLVDRLRTNFADIAEEYPCVFLTTDSECAIHDLPERPRICQDFLCDKEHDDEKC